MSVYKYVKSGLKIIHKFYKALKHSQNAFSNTEDQKYYRNEH